MTLKLALIRCGRTDSDEQGRLFGAYDEPLSEGGREEIAAFAREERPGATLLFTGEAACCRETAALLYPRTLAVILRNLQPFDYGDFKDCTLTDLQRDKLFRQWAESEASLPCPGGESLHAFGARCAGALRAMVGEMSSKGIEQAAVVTHGAVIGAMLQKFCIPRSVYRNWEPSFGKGYLVGVDPINFMVKILSVI